MWCSKLEEIIIPKSVTTIEYRAFALCSKLKSITIPNKVTKIGKEAFIVCNSLEKAIIPKSVTSLGKDIFYGCDKVTIYAKKGSKIQKYANKNQYRCIIN